jgi:hypothetical protein
MDPETWPRTAKFGGQECSLWVQTGAYDAISFVCSLKDVTPGNAYGLMYAPNKCDSKARPSELFGPAYFWRGDGVLEERSWSEGTRPQRNYEYMYYPTGELFRINYHESGPDHDAGHGHYVQLGPWEHSSEVFGRNGTLLGISLANGSEGETTLSANYWMGERVNPGEFTAHISEIIRSVWR